MNNDLISRSELKKSLRWIEDNPYIDLDREIMQEIDNAPAVELTEEQAIDKLYETGWLIRHDKEMTERPKGEWIDYDNTFYKCPDCGYLLEKCCPQCQNKVILPKGGAE